jgi:tetratricopeptide (TPR) repeat protein
MAYLKKAEAITKSNDSKYLAFYTTRDFGEYNNHSKQYRKAAPDYEKALALTSVLNNAIQKNDLLYTLFGLFIKIGDYPKAVKYGQQSLDLAQKTKSKKFYTDPKNGCP